MSYNEQETRFFLIDPVLREKGYDSHQWLKLETPAPVEPTGPKGKRRKGSGRTDYLLCVQVGDMPKSLPVAVLEAKKESDDPLNLKTAVGCLYPVDGSNFRVSAGVKTGNIFL